MSNYEAEARYEHASTIVDWNSASSDPPRFAPPSDDDGWMLFSQNPARSVELFVDGVRVERFLCVWRRRLTRVESKKPTRAESIASWKSKKEEDAKRLEEEQAAQRLRWQERERLEKEREAAEEMELAHMAQSIGRVVWESVKDVHGVRALMFDKSRHTQCRWLLFFRGGVPDRSERVKEANRLARGVGFKAPLVQRVDMNLARANSRLVVIGSNDPEVHVSQATAEGAGTVGGGQESYEYERGAIFKGHQLVGESVLVTISAPNVSESHVGDDDDYGDLFGGRPR